MIKSRREIDEVTIKKEIEAATDWSAQCPICKKTITGSLADLRKHGACHND